VALGERPIVVMGAGPVELRRNNRGA
jgi:hypothetical protein